MAFNFTLKQKKIDFIESQNEQNGESEFYQSISLFVKQRKQCEISLEELSKKTKISRNVLIAIENGWKKYLPEKIYLVTIIKRLEDELNLESGSLNGILTKKLTNKNPSVFKFKFINIDFLNSWVGSLLYILLMLLAILALNSQQKYLIKLNTQSNEPIVIKEPAIDNKN